MQGSAGMIKDRPALPGAHIGLSGHLREQWRNNEVDKLKGPLSIPPLGWGLWGGGLHMLGRTGKNRGPLHSLDFFPTSLNSRPRSEPNRNTVQRIKRLPISCLGFSSPSLPLRCTLRLTS